MEDQAYSRMSADLLRSLRCPFCRVPLVEESGVGYGCTICRRTFPFHHKVVRFVDAASYADSFGYQWHWYARTQLDYGDIRNSERDFCVRTGFTAEELRGKHLLDVGCGMGRFADRKSTRLNSSHQIISYAV